MEMQQADEEVRLNELDTTSRLSFLNENSLPDAFLESMFKRPDIFDTVDFPNGDDVPRTPERLSPPQRRQQEDEENPPPSASVVSGCLLTNLWVSCVKCYS